MKDNIKYGWIDINGEEHIQMMKDFRRKYRISSLEVTLSHGLGICIEQVYLMHTLLDSINVENKMFCTFYKDEKAFHIEHSNWERVGIYKYDSEEVALKEINDYFVEMADGKSRPVCEFFELILGLYFKEFNNYVNNLSDIKIK